MRTRLFQTSSNTLNFNFNSIGLIKQKHKVNLTVWMKIFLKNSAAKQQQHLSDQEEMDSFKE